MLLAAVIKTPLALAKSLATAFASGRGKDQPWQSGAKACAHEEHQEIRYELRRYRRT